MSTWVSIAMSCKGVKLLILTLDRVTVEGKQVSELWVLLTDGTDELIYPAGRGHQDKVPPLTTWITRERLHVYTYGTMD